MNTLLHLSLINHIGPATILPLLNSLASVNHYSTTDFIHTFDFSQKVASYLVEGLKDKKLLDDELSLIEKYGISLITIADKEYPEDLKHIHLPPIVLYCKGEPLGTTKRIAIVGSRKADAYGEKCIKTIIPDLVTNGWSIVSGGAAGIDTIAHTETLKNNGKTVVIFGSGLMHTYPRENKLLFQTIARTGGTIVSPFPLKAPPHKGNFPARNRIISGLSQGCIVVQAARKSGALITAQFALEQGKQVFAFPGRIDHELSEGCHKIIQDGAKLVMSTNDIFEEFGEPVQQSLLG